MVHAGMILPYGISMRPEYTVVKSLLLKKQEVWQNKRAGG